MNGLLEKKKVGNICVFSLLRKKTSAACIEDLLVQFETLKVCGQNSKVNKQENEISA